MSQEALLEDIVKATQAMLLQPKKCMYIVKTKKHT